MSVRLTSASTEHAIRERAYYLWEQDGRPHGRDMEFWSRAAAEAEAKPKRVRAAAATVKPVPTTTAPVKATGRKRA